MITFNNKSNLTYKIGEGQTYQDFIERHIKHFYGSINDCIKEYRATQEKIIDKFNRDEVA